jgi:cytoskeletal protein RodZ
MALSMDEQRMLAEIERRLSAEDPRLAARLSSFRRPGPATGFRSPRGRIIGSLFTVVLVAVVSLMVYAMVPFRAHSPRTPSSPPQASTSQGISPRPGQASGSATSADKTTAPKTSTAKTTVAQTTAPRTTAARATAARNSASKAGTGVTRAHVATATRTSNTARTRAPAQSHT